MNNSKSRDKDNNKSRRNKKYNNIVKELYRNYGRK